MLIENVIFENITIQNNDPAIIASSSDNFEIKNSIFSDVLNSIQIQDIPTIKISSSEIINSKELIFGTIQISKSSSLEIDNLSIAGVHSSDDEEDSIASSSITSTVIISQPTGSTLITNSSFENLISAYGAIYIKTPVASTIEASGLTIESNSAIDSTLGSGFNIRDLSEGTISISNS